MGWKQNKKRNEHLKKTYQKTKNEYGAGVYFDENKGRYIRYSCHDKELKLKGRRIIRRKLKTNYNEEYISEKASYKKQYDYWWKIL